jgi:hypothetical protein
MGVDHGKFITEPGRKGADLEADKRLNTRNRGNFVVAIGFSFKEYAFNNDPSSANFHEIEKQIP